ncbi:zf-TFIIB domain-containing protein [Aquabacter sp. CN5-332]|uniref:TFIIB-type zinc ribbon-containing protein n=1 Tax=Aquabacter sp. CN5-332 TaxID=3156608 RepID=UPI0032B540AD
MTNPAVGMPCPVCKLPLVMSERQGVEIDYCPQCRGVWLDRGELDKIIERSGREAASQPQAQPQPAPAYQPQPAPAYQPQGYAQQGYGQQGYGQPYGGDHGKQGYPKRKKSFLEDLFD